MYAQTDQSDPAPAPAPENGLQPPAGGATMTTSRVALRTRPRTQRALIRSWQYNQPVRITFLVIRLLVVLWLVVLSTVLLSASNTWGWALLAGAAAVLALSVWVFSTAAKGWPAAGV